MKVTALKSLGLAAILGTWVSLASAALDIPQECGTASGHNTGSISVCGEGQYTDQTSSTDKRKASELASEALSNALFQLSGVQCSTCLTQTAGDDLVLAQCQGLAELVEGTLVTTYEEIHPGASTPVQGWKVTKCWTGSYRVHCKCPPLAL